MPGRGRIAAYLEERLELPTIWARFTDRPIPKGIGWLHTFGSATLFLLLIQAITGVLLAFYYVPSPEHAYESVRIITTDLAFGRIVRGIHRWGASLAVIFIGLHLLRTLLMGSFKYPRELTWAVGVLLLLVVLLFAFTGYLLPWDQRAYWATVVGTHIAGYTPGIGPFLMEVLRGQPEVGTRTLGRFYASHVLFLPAALFLLVAIHLFMVVKQGIAPSPDPRWTPRSREEEREYYRRAKGEGRPFYEIMAKDALVALALTVLLVALAAALGAPLGDEADPAATTYVPRPEWYFLFLYELLWWFPGKWIQIAAFWIPLGIVLLLLSLPWLDRSVHRHPLRRPAVSSVTIAFLAAAGFLTYKGVRAPLPPAPERTQAEAAGLSPRALEGLDVYARAGCSACHTIDGQGGGAGPDLSRVGRTRSEEWLMRYTRDPRSVNPSAEMPPFGELTDEELRALAAYLAARR